MTHRRSAALAAALLLFGTGFMAQAATIGAKAFLHAVNTDADKTISKDELDAYARKKFAEIEKDNDKTLDAKELKGRLSARGMASVDTDNDKTVDEQEFVGYADKLFEEANTKGQKTLSLRELESSAGKKLIKLLQ